MKKIVFLSVLSLFLFTGCQVGGGLRIDNGFYHAQHLPAHAPAHGRRHHRYHYYPNAEFYFDVGREMYFYLDSRGAWAFSVNLPHHLHGHLNSGYVEIDMEDDRPYLRHKHHKNKYKKHKYKNKLKYKYKKKKHRKKHDKYRDDEEDKYRHKKKRRYERD